MSYNIVTRPDHVRAEKRRNFAFQLRSAGLTYNEIVEAVRNQFPDEVPPSYDNRYAYNDVKLMLDHLRIDLKEDSQFVRMIMLEQIDRVMITVYDMAQKGNLKAIDRMLKLQTQKARLVGAYAPSEVKINDWRSEILQLMQTHKIDEQQVREYLGEQLYREFVESRSPALLEAGTVEEGEFTDLDEELA